MKKKQNKSETGIQRHPLYPYRDINGKLLPGHPKFGGVKKKTVDELYCTFIEFKQEMEKSKSAVTIQQFTARLGMTKNHFIEYYVKDPEYREVVDYIKAELEAWIMQYSLSGKAQFVIMSYLKNFFEWKDDKTLFIAGIKDAPPIRVSEELHSLGRRLSGIHDESPEEESSDDDGTD